MTREMKEFMTQLSEVDGMATELAYRLRDASEDFKNENLMDRLADLLLELEATTTDIKESEGWL